jgi:cell division protein FtsN
MPSFERGVYEPPNDDIRVFDDDELDTDEEGSRLPLLIVIALLVLAAFGGVVYLAYSQGVQRGRADAPRMIVAAPGPVKEAATDGSSAPTNHLKIYDQPAPADDSADDNAPPAPAAQAKPAPAPVVAAPPPAETKPAPEKSVAAVEKSVTKPVPAASKPAAVAASQAALTPTASAPPTPLVAAPPKAEAPAAAPKATEAIASGGAYELQIGAYKSTDEAEAAWKAYKFKHPSAAGYSDDVRKADLGDKGVWYRLRIGPFSDKAAASEACDKLKADGGACMLAK